MNNAQDNDTSKVLEKGKDLFDESNRIIEENKIHIISHLSKFDNLDNFFKETEDIISEYYRSENFNNIEDFEKFLTILLKKYIYFFNFEGDLHEKLELKKEIDEIENKYDKLIYFGEYNPIEEKRKRESINKGAILIVKDYIYKILGKK